MRVCEAAVVLALGVPPGVGAAQTVVPAPEAIPTLPRLSGPIVLDGHVTETAWDAIAPLPLTLYSPVYRGTPTERTEIRLAYDDRYLYASGRF